MAAVDLCRIARGDGRRTVASLIVRFMRSTLAIDLGMLDLSQPMFNAILSAAHIEHMHRVSCCRVVRVAAER